jgi:hypothetical protein
MKNDHYLKFEQDLQKLIKKNNLQKITNTPEFILAGYVVDAFRGFEYINREKDSYTKTILNRKNL